MKRRWIIRGLFMGLLLLCVGGWLVSYKYRWDVGHTGADNSAWGAMAIRGKIHLTWLDDSSAKKGWSFSSQATDVEDDSFFEEPFHRQYRLGFLVKREDHWTWVVIPFYFPTAVCAILLWFVWRKIRPKAKGRAFPVGVDSARGNR